MTKSHELKLCYPQDSTYMIGQGILGHIPQYLSKFSYDRLCVVFDQTLPSNLLQNVLSPFKSLTSHFLPISGLEAHKTWQTVETLVEAFHAIPLTRYSFIVAIGGGVIGDVVGFTASIYKRGIAWAFVPTTLIAQIDSSIGGKTSINAAWGKNQLGTFHCPRLVTADPHVLTFLPPRHLQAGMAEIIKIAAMMDEDLLNRLHTCSLSNLHDMEDVLKAAVRLKMDIVTDDPFEEKPLGRKRLNFGHTIGHAVEFYYAPHIIHGEAVAIGMLAELDIALKQKKIPFKDNWISSFHELVTKFVPLHSHYPLPTWTELLFYLRQDKKNIADHLSLILPHPTEKAAQISLPWDKSYH